MARPFRKLRSKMYDEDINQIYLGELIHKSESYITSRFTAKKPWTLDDAYKVLDALSIPKEQIFDYFPPKGRAV